MKNIKNSSPVGDYEDSNPRFHMATGAGYNDFHPTLSKEMLKKIRDYRNKTIPYDGGELGSTDRDR